LNFNGLIFSTSFFCDLVCTASAAYNALPEANTPTPSPSSFVAGQVSRLSLKRRMKTKVATPQQVLVLI
jgi:hypothetical protein